MGDLAMMMMMITESNCNISFDYFGNK